jgi:hypothetical protein
MLGTNEYFIRLVSFPHLAKRHWGLPRTEDEIWGFNPGSRLSSGEGLSFRYNRNNA